MTEKPIEKKYVVYWNTGSNVHHYFATYEQAKKYVSNSRTEGINIAYLLSSTKKSLTEDKKVIKLLEGVSHET